MLGRVLRYGEKIFGLYRALGTLRDGRARPRIPAGRVAQCYLVLFLARLGSLNALEQRRASRVWRRFVGGGLPSADVMGDVVQSLPAGAVRDLLRRQHARLKRNKGFARVGGGLRYLVLDGHEGVASYRRQWQGALERVVHTAQGERTQCYFRYVMAYLTTGRERLLLDAEPQLPGEGEIACALRLLERVLQTLPRAFEAVCGDNLYMSPELWRLARRHGKHVVAVLKNEDRDLMVDARALFAQQAPVCYEEDGVHYACWDLEGFTTWPQCGEAVRVVRTVETRRVKRQRGGFEEEVAEWMWVTSLAAVQLATRALVRVGHGRWGIENHGFNELCTGWHADHGYRYHAHALLVCVLLLFLAYNLFHTFVTRNLKPEARVGRSVQYWADLIRAEFVRTFHSPARPP